MKCRVGLVRDVTVSVIFTACVGFEQLNANLFAQRIPACFNKLIFISVSKVLFEGDIFAAFFIHF